MAKWIKKWDVQGSKGNTYTVSLGDDGSYGCSCPVWKFRREECKHIKQVKSTNVMGMPIDKPKKAKVEKPKSEKPSRPDYIVGVVLTPTLIVKSNQLIVPLTRYPNTTHMEATICNALLENGYAWDEVKYLRQLPPEWTEKYVREYVSKHGQAEYEPLTAAG